MTEHALTTLPAPAPGGDYNLVPYISKPFPQSQPPRLAALAALFGLSAPPVSQCRVLELGCASGGNIIPLALRFPGSRFRGVDLTERHVRDGQARIAALGLANIRVDQGDIAALDLRAERFDYIVCHGVYSWVPPHVRDAILRIAAEHLADNGIAYVSYNVYPGWHLRGVIRDMMVYHAGMDGDPKLRVAKARWVLDNIAKSSRAGSPYGEMLRREANLLARMDDAYILGEFLERENAPCYFRDFAAKADGFGLAYLCEAELSLCIPEHITPEVGQLIRTMSANNLIPLEQYMDFFNGRAFRQTLLVKTAQAKSIQRILVPERARGLHASGRVSCTATDDGSWVFSAANGGTLTTRDEAVHRALQRLSEAYPGTRTVRELAAEVRALDREAALLDAVFRAILVGLLDISSVPLRLDPTSAARPRPRAGRLARLDAEHGGTWTTGPAHSAVPLDLVCANLLPLMDGRHDREALKGALLAAVREGRIRITDKTSGLDLAGSALDEAAAQHVSAAIDSLAAAGILG
jgi:SAM-dependent methyltransferase/methyltransferase-like protein